MYISVEIKFLIAHTVNTYTVPIRQWTNELYRNQSKLLSSKKIAMKRDFAAGVYMSEARNPIHPPYTLYMYVYTSILIHTQGRGEAGEELNQRDGERGNS
jgi:hypothetical protein